MGISLPRGSLSPFGRAPATQHAHYRIPLVSATGLVGKGFGLGTCGRTNTGWFFNPTDGYLDSAASGVARIERRGLLVEPASTNMILRSRAFTTSPWTNQTTAAQDEIGIDGSSNTAWTVDDDDSVSRERVYQSITIPNDSSPWCASIFIKKSKAPKTNYPALEIGCTGGTSVFAHITMNLYTGAVNPHITYVPTAYGCDSYGDWWRFWVSVTNNVSGNTTGTFYFWPSYNSDFTDTEDQTSIGSCIIDQAQGELGIAVPTSPIITEGTSVIRNTDSGLYTWPIPSVVSTMLSSTGTMICLWTPMYDYSIMDNPEYNKGIISVDDTADSILLSSRYSEFVAIVGSYDGTNQPTVTINWSRGKTYLIAINWGVDGTDIEVGFNYAGEWTWGSSTAFAGSFPDAGILSLGVDQDYPSYIKNINFYSLLTQSQVEAMFP